MPSGRGDIDSLGSYNPRVPGFYKYLYSTLDSRDTNASKVKVLRYPTWSFARLPACAKLCLYIRGYIGTLCDLARGPLNILVLMG